MSQNNKQERKRNKYLLFTTLLPILFIISRKEKEILSFRPHFHTPNFEKGKKTKINPNIRISQPLWLVV